MGYYCTLTNILDEASKLVTIVPTPIKYEYFWTSDENTQLSGHVLRQNNIILYEFDLVCVYIDDLLILPRGDWENH